VIVYLNGEWLDEADALIPIDDLGFLQGDGVFETARLHRGGYFRLPRHLERLAESARMLRLPMPDAGHLGAVAARLATRNALDEGSLRITITRGRPGGEATLLATLQPIAAEWQRRAERGWRIVTARTTRPAPRSIPAALKSLGRVYSILARLEVRPHGTDDVLLLSEAGQICEGPSWNVFWRRGSLLRTPSAHTGALDGVTRAAVLELAPAAGFSVEQGEWPRAQLDDAEEVFATMSSVGIVPVRSLDGRNLASDAAARLLQARYWELVAREVAARTDPPGTDRA
jgi:branched-chain amino acid aminotransferase